MKNWLRLVFSRIGRVITELISVKVVVMCVVTFLYLQTQETTGIVGYLATILGWFLVIGLRFASKWTALLSAVKKD